MIRPAEQLRTDAVAIWQAGVAAVDSGRLMREAVSVDNRQLSFLGQSDDRLAIDLDQIDRIAVVGAGKAGAGMAAALEAILGPQLLAEKQVAGWVNVPADCLRPLEKIQLCAARPAGSNEPTVEGGAGSEEILQRVAALGPNDLCICLISGGASALMPAPAAGLALNDKLAVTRHLASAGANITELNTVRKQLSRIKGGKLAQACGAGQFVTLIISDVLGDPLDVIGSGPTVPDSSTSAAALAILNRFGAREAGIAPAVFDYLERPGHELPPRQSAVHNLVIGNNARAVAAAGVEAARRGYPCETVAATQLEGEAEPIGRRLAETALAMRAAGGPGCLIQGGEPVVRLAAADVRGLGGRNQQLVLAAVERLWNDPIAGMVLLSGGTDGEDGPTDAAGAWLDAELIERARLAGLNPGDFLQRNDAYHFFEPLGGLLQTGPTHTNVCDLRVVLVARD